MAARIRLTKKRLSALHTALSLDDILYEKFRRLDERLKNEYQKLYQAKQIVRVYQKRPDGILVCLQIEDVQIGPEGTTVITK